MMKHPVIKLLKILIPFILFFHTATAGFCLTSDVTHLKHYTLENGLELFVLENHALPLVRIQITVRCGSIAQSAETAGLFHLYEHMMFKGNKVYRTQSQFQTAMREIGVANWNGGTSTEFVSYHFTVLSERVEKGIEFWANAIRFPLLDPGELEREKSVVINEIRGYFDDPDHIYQAAIDKALFFKFPFRRDVAGYENAVRSATPAMLEQIQASYYIPNNAALFIGGAAEEINDVFKEAADNRLKGILQFCQEELVSVDFMSSSYSSIVDAALTKVIDGNFIKVFAWYDNESGYACRIRDLALYMGNRIGV